jgi:hypothetical protein
MKKLIQIKQSFCDICGKKASGYDKCIICERDFCYDCVKTETIEYKHAVHFSGSGDGQYCHACNKKAFDNGDKLHAAYCKIASLRNEEIGWYSNFKERAEKAETALKKLQKI